MSIGVPVEVSGVPPDCRIELQDAYKRSRNRCRSFSLTDSRRVVQPSWDFISARLSPAYKSTSGSLLRGFARRPVEEPVPETPDAEAAAQIDAGNSPPADHSLFFDNLERLKDVGIDGERVKSAICGAVSPAEMKLLLDMERGHVDEAPDGALFPSSTPRFKNVAYLWACFTGLVDLLPRLEISGANADLTDPVTGVNAMLVSALSNSTACVEYLIKKRGMDCVAVQAESGHTPLHFAAFGNAREAAEILLDAGAAIGANSSPLVEPVLHCAIRAQALETVALLLDRGASVALRNQAGETPLHVACFVQSTRCAKLLLERPEVEVNAAGRGGRTPLHFAVMSTRSSPELIAALLARGADVNAVDEEGYAPVHIAALNELSGCVNALIRAGADLSAKTRSGVSALGVILRKIPDSLDAFRQRLDASLRLRRPAASSREFELRLDFDPLYPSRDNGDVRLVNTFLEEHRKDLLMHPLVTAFLHLKWEKMRKFYLLRIAAYFVTVVCLTAYVLTTVTRHQCFESQALGPPIINEDLGPAGVRKFCRDNRVWYSVLRNVIAAEYYLLVFLTCLTAVRKFFGFFFYHSVKEYFSYADNILDIFVMVGLFVAAFAYHRETNTWQNYVVSISVLCAWTNLMLMVGQLPAFATYVAMFTQVQWEFAKLLMAYSGVLIGFTVSFCISFAGEPSFANPLIGFIKVLAMMAGEVDFEGLMVPGDGSPASYAISLSSQVLFTLFLFFVTVIMMNLLVGIAVDDIKGLRRDAGITKVVRQTKLVVFVEVALRKSVVPRCIRERVLGSRFPIQERKRVLTVKPLNPLEKRLPKDILCAAYEIAEKNAPLDGDAVLEDEDDVKNIEEKETLDVDKLNSAVKQLEERLNAQEESIRIVKGQLQRTNRTLEEILSLLRESDC